MNAHCVRLFTMRTLLRNLLVITVAASSLGCGKQDVNKGDYEGFEEGTLHGAWREQAPQGKKLAVVHELFFQPEGTYRTYTFRVGETRRITVRGKYKFDSKSNRLKSSPREVDFEGWTQDEQDKFRKTIAMTLMEPDSGTVEWSGPDKFKYVPDPDPKAKKGSKEAEGTAVYVRVERRDK